MPWQRGRYYVRARKQGGRVVFEYIGSGPGAEAIAALDIQKRLEKKAVAEALRKKREKAEKLNAKVIAFFNVVAAFSVEILSAAGYHRIKRGPWRKKRGEKPMSAETTKLEKPPSTSTASQAKTALDVLLDNIEHASKDKKALAIVEKTLAAMPEIPAFLGLARQLEHQLFKAAGMDQASKAIWAAELEKLKAKLAGKDPTPLEALLAERAAVCWLQVQLASWRQAILQSDSHSIATGLYRERCVDSANRRFLSACKALAEVRKLQRPSLAVALFQQQDGQRQREDKALASILSGKSQGNQAKALLDRTAASVLGN